MIFRLLPVVPVLFWVITVILIIRIIKLNHNSILVTGKIVQIKRERERMMTSRNVVEKIIPVIEYYFNGELRRFEGGYCSPTTEAGSEIELLCNKSDGKKVVIKKGRFIAPLITGSLALAFSVVYVIIVTVKIKISG